MTFEEAFDRYLDILMRISYIKNPAEKAGMYSQAYFAVGLGLSSWDGKKKPPSPKTEAEIASLEKMLSDKGA